ncbi:hypothetical protein [Pseudoblastomonas halimionae]|uniref:Uncharacterized protein n=1 Tax=Alteriqipengyuania halimionae TaxID=1926630 RepID=A0A6I4U296_9SPHN|nr:hypothetical protein [Alteriqipengyuania halimionae]MXP09053.1 hypothetical protein [Alteriqipengyuania halimionae]
METNERIQLLLSAQRALNGNICNGVRQVWVRKVKNKIEIRSRLALEHDAEAEECLRVAATEMLADDPDAEISEQFEVSDDKLKLLGAESFELVFERYEPS